MKADKKLREATAATGDATFLRQHGGMEPFSGASSIKYDLTIRLAKQGDQTRVAVAPTERVLSQLRSYTDRLDKRRKALGVVIDGLKSMIDYNGHYIAFLHGNLSEDEFEAIATTFLWEPTSANVISLADDLAVLFASCKADFMPSELAQIFRCTESDVEEAIACVVQIADGSTPNFLNSLTYTDR